MQILKRSGEKREFDTSKIETAIQKAFLSVGLPVDSEKIRSMVDTIEERVKTQFPKGHIVTVEEIQDLVEIVLIENNYYAVVKSYILYRASHHTMRKVIEDFEDYFSDKSIVE